MKRLLLAIALLGVTTMYSQTYVSVSGGYGFELNTKVLGRDATNPTSIKAAMEQAIKYNYVEDISSINVGAENWL